MNNTNHSPDRIKEIAKSLRQPTPEEIKQLDEELAVAVKAANEHAKAKGWQEPQK